MLLKLERTLVVFDTETTGLDHRHDRIVQFGAIKIQPDGNMKEWETLINPDCEIPEKVTAIHGITNDMVKDAPTFKEVCPTIDGILDDSDLCGYNVLFDIRFLKAELKRLRLELLPCSVIDPFFLFKAYDSKDHKLITAVRFLLDRDHSGAHTALADAKATFEVLEKLLEKNSDLPRTPKELYDLCYKQTPSGFIDRKRLLSIDSCGIIRLNFGKHKGKTLTDAPRDYLEWVLTGDFSNVVKDAIKKGLL